MAAYMLAFVRIKDVEAFQREYIQKAHALVEKHGGKSVAATEKYETIEGSLPEGRVVILEFPSMEKAKAFYDDPEYQPLKKIRKTFCDSDSIIFETL
jgi:uncharacterized protein (DUF1330 family)